jgi:hypothetical protein
MIRSAAARLSSSVQPDAIIRKENARLEKPVSRNDLMRAPASPKFGDHSHTTQTHDALIGVQHGKLGLGTRQKIAAMDEDSFDAPEKCVGGKGREETRGWWWALSGKVGGASWCDREWESPRLRSDVLRVWTRAR